jgi:cysteine desulfurase
MIETKRIYLDHCATTPVHPEVMETMLPYFKDFYGNPSSIYAFGQDASKALDEAREKVAHLIGAQPEEIVFTSGGTEADNLAIQGIAYACEKKGNHIITSAIEHHAVLRTCKYMECRGCEVTYLPVNRNGLVDPEDVKKTISDKTILISIMHANNETGTIEPVQEIATIAREKGIIFHTDAVQTAGNIPIDVNHFDVDLLSLSGHKIYGPKGIGALYVRKGTKIIPILYGGRQERGIRPGTENVAAIAGLGRACEIAKEECLSHADRLKQLRDHLQEGILKEILDVHVNADIEQRLPHVLNISVEGIEAESIVRSMSDKRIEISAGSACTSDSIEISHVISALGIPRNIGKGSIRLSLGRGNTMMEIDHAVESLKEVVHKLRVMAELEKSLGRGGCV